MTTTPPTDYTAQACTLLDRLIGSTRRDRVAFAYGYILAFDAMASALPPRDLAHHRNIATALHNLCAEELQ